MNDSPATLSRSRFRFLCALLFCTGMTSLIFQIIWLRGFSIILGSTIYSMACVVTVFESPDPRRSCWMRATSASNLGLPRKWRNRCSRER